jgi:hypothetical protein
MKNILLLAVLFLSLETFAQNSNLVIFSEQGERFTVILNGIKQNASPETNVKITDLNQPGYKLKIIFEDQQIPDLDKNIPLEPGMEVVTNVKKNNKGAYVLRFLSSAPIVKSAPAPGQAVVVYSTTPPPPPATVTTVTTTTTNVAPANGVSVGMNVNGVGVNMNVNISEPVYSESTTTTYSTTTTTSTQNPPPKPNVYEMPGYNRQVGCPWPMSPQDFSGVKQSIASKSFDDSRLQIAKQVLSTNCLLSSQVRDIMTLFSFEDTKLQFAKYAYGYTYDLGNYYKLNDAFTFESSIDELNTYIQAQRN